MSGLQRFSAWALVFAGFSLGASGAASAQDLRTQPISFGSLVSIGIPAGWMRSQERAVLPALLLKFAPNANSRNGIFVHDAGLPLGPASAKAIQEVYGANANIAAPVALTPEQIAGLSPELGNVGDNQYSNKTKPPSNDAPLFQVSSAQAVPVNGKMFVKLEGNFIDLATGQPRVFFIGLFSPSDIGDRRMISIYAQSQDANEFAMLREVFEAATKSIVWNKAPPLAGGQPLSGGGRAPESGALIGGRGAREGGALIGGDRSSLPPQFRGEAGAPSAMVPLTTSVVAEVQERLYNLNYDPGPINGQLTAQTRTALAALQRRYALAPSGQIDESVLKVLRERKAPSQWGALAFDARGTYSAIWRANTRRQAEEAVSGECRKRARGACKLATAADAQCIAYARAGGRSGRRRNFGSFTVVRDDVNSARGAAIEYCQRESPFPDSCEVRLTLCADGSHVP